MWEWLLQKSKIVSSSYVKNFQDREDIVQDIMVDLFEDKQMAERIYSPDQPPDNLLNVIIQNKLFKYNSQSVTYDKTEYFRYIKIMNVCKQYGINPIPRNAYIIAPFVTDYDLSISRVERILRDIKPQTVSLDALSNRKVGQEDA